MVKDKYLLFMSIDELIEEFNDGDWDNIKNIFSDLKTFFYFLKRRGRLDDVMDEFTSYSDLSDTTFENEFLLYLYEHEKEKFYEMVNDAFDDFKYIDGDAYLLLDDISDLSKLFCAAHRTIVSNLLSGDYDWDNFYDTTDDVYSDVVEELTPVNLEILKNFIISTYNNYEFEADTDLLQEISMEQGDDGEYFKLTSGNIDRIFESSDSMKSILSSSQTDELRWELESVHSSAYNSAYVDEQLGQMWGELSRIFKDKGEEVPIKGVTNKDGSQRKMFKIKLNPSWEKNVVDFIRSNQTYHGSFSTIGYYGGYIEFYKEDDCLELDTSDFYPSWGKEWSELINSSFSDYF
jgi:hypothetical protein